MEKNDALSSMYTNSVSIVHLDDFSKPLKAVNFRHGESEKARFNRLNYLRRHASLKRATESPEEREERLQYLRRRAIERRSTETLEVRQERLKATRERAAKRRATENSEEREKRLQYLRERSAMRRATENSEERQKRLENTRIYNIKRRAEARKEKEALMKVVWNGKLRPRKNKDNQEMALFSSSDNNKIIIEVQPDLCYEQFMNVRKVKDETDDPLKVEKDNDTKSNSDEL